MSTTLIYFNVSKPTNLDKQLGRLTLAEACEVLDAVSAVKTVCLHVFAENNREVPQHYTRRLDGLNLQMSLAQARGVLTQWRKLTRWCHGEQLPDLVTLDLFLTSDQLKALSI